MVLSKKNPKYCRCNATWLNSVEDEYGAGGVGLLGKILPLPGHSPTEFTDVGLGFKLGGEEEMWISGLGRGLLLLEQSHPAFPAQVSSRCWQIVFMPLGPAQDSLLDQILWIRKPSDIILHFLIGFYRYKPCKHQVSPISLMGTEEFLEWLTDRGKTSAADSISIRSKKQNHARPLKRKTADGLGAKRPMKRYSLSTAEGGRERGREAFWVSASWEGGRSQICLYLYFPEESWAVQCWDLLCCTRSSELWGIGMRHRPASDGPCVELSPGNVMEAGPQTCVRASWRMREKTTVTSESDNLEPTCLPFTSPHVLHDFPFTSPICSMLFPQSI